MQVKGGEHLEPWLQLGLHLRIANQFCVVEHGPKPVHRPCHENRQHVLL